VKIPQQLRPSSSLSLHMRGLISRSGLIIPIDQSTIAAVRDPADKDQRKLEAKRARRAQLKRQKGKP